MSDRNKPAFWLYEIARAENLRSEVADDYEWEKLERIFDTGASRVLLEAETPAADSRELAQSTFVNWIYAFTETFIPATYFRHPQVRVKPTAPQWIANAVHVSRVINKTLEQVKLRRTLRRLIRDALCYGHAWIKVGWYTREGVVPILGGKANRGDGSVSQLDTEAWYRIDEPYAIRLSPKQVYMDPEADYYEQASWICHESFVPFDAVQKDPYLKYKNEIAPVSYERGVAALDIPGDFEKEHKLQWAKRWEIWDRETKRVYVLFYGASRFALDIPWPYPDLEAFPFRMLSFIDPVDRLYPYSPILPWLPLVEELSFLRSMRLYHLSKMTPKALVPPGVLDERSEIDFADPLIDIVKTNDEPSRIVPWQGVKPDPQLYAAEEYVKNDIREISGFSELLSGSVPFSRLPATTTAIMQRNAALRFDSYSERIGDFLVDVAKDLFKIVRRFSSYPILVELAGDPDPQWMEITRQELEGEYQFTIRLEDMSVSNKEEEIKETYDALVALSPFPEVNRRALIRDHLIARGRADLREYLLPETGPAMDPTQENQLMAQGYPVEPNVGEDFELHLRVHAEFLESPAFRQYLTSLPPAMQKAVQDLFSQHIQTTTNLLRARQEREGTASRTPNAQQTTPKPGLTTNLQRGQAIATSQPVGGQERQPLGAGEVLSAAIRNAMR